MHILAFDEGMGKYTGMLGALQCQGEFKNIEVYSGVGTGFTEEQRKDIWERREKLSGTIVEIEYLDITNLDKNGRYFSLRSPSFKCLRIDK